MRKSLAVLALSLMATSLHAETAKPVCGAPPKPVADYLKAHPGLKITDVPNLGPDNQKFWNATYANQCPGLIDFNADGSGHAAFGLLLVKETADKFYEQIVVLHYAKGAYRAHIIHPFEEGSNGVLLRAKPGKYEEFPPDDRPAKTVNLKYEGVEFVYFETSSGLIYFEGGKFKEIWTSD